MITVWATHSFPGWHSWPDAPASRIYLASPHRHLFHVRADLEVEGLNRTVEFHDLLSAIRRACSALGVNSIYGDGRDLGNLSCEMIARLVMDTIRSSWSGAYVSVEVSEDGEAGARISQVR